jgi:hypothetical protein
MLRRRPRRAARSWVRHPSTGWLFLAALYLTAAIVNLLLALSMAVWWPAVLAALMAGVAVVFVVCAIR